MLGTFIYLGFDLQSSSADVNFSTKLQTPEGTDHITKFSY
jgi:hypothetical protein